MKYVLRKIFLVQTLAVMSLFAADPGINIQGVLRDESGSAVADGTFSVTVHIYNLEEGGAAIWYEEHPEVTAKNGVYSIYLGSEKTLRDLSFSEPYFVALSVNGGEESSPRIPLSLSPYSLAVQGVSNVVPSYGNVGIGVTDPDHKLEVQGGNVKIENNNANSQLSFNDPGDAQWTVGMDASDHKFKLSNTADVHSNPLMTVDHSGILNITNSFVTSGYMFQDATSSYDVWLQGSTASSSSGDSRNLALLGSKGVDRLYVNYNSEYKGGTVIGGPVQLGWSGSMLNNIQVGIIGNGKPSSAGYTGTVTFPHAFSKPPMVFCQVAEFDNNGAVSVRVTQVSATGFSWNSWTLAKEYAADQIWWMAFEN